MGEAAAGTPCGSACQPRPARLLSLKASERCCICLEGAMLDSKQAGQWRSATAAAERSNAPKRSISRQHSALRDALSTSTCSSSRECSSRRAWEHGAAGTANRCSNQPAAARLCGPLAAPPRPALQVALDVQHHQTMASLQQRVSSRERIVGWFSTGDPDASRSRDALIHSFYGQECPNPVHLALDTSGQGGRMGVRAFVSRALSIGGRELAREFLEVRVGLGGVWQGGGTGAQGIRWGRWRPHLHACLCCRCRSRCCSAHACGPAPAFSPLLIVQFVTCLATSSPHYQAQSSIFRPVARLLAHAHRWTVRCGRARRSGWAWTC